MSYRDELQAAIARAEAAERRLEATCAVHPQTPVAAACASCNKNLCSACLMVSLQGTFCGACFVKQRQRELRQRLTIVAIGLGAMVATVLGAIIAWRPQRAALSGLEHPPRLSAVDREAMRRADLVRQLALEPCSQTIALELADAYNRAHDYGRSLRVTDDFLRECGAFPRLLWSAYYAHEQRGEWAEAAARAAELIVTQPGDMDFWWWRGDALAQQKRRVEAASDFRQAMALGATRLVPWRFAELAAELGRPCEGVFAFAHAFAADQDNETERALQRQRQLWNAGQCEDEVGQGEVTIVPSARAGGLRTYAGIDGGPRGQFAVEDTASYVVMSRAFAARAGIAADGSPVWVYVTGKILPAHLTRVSSLSLHATPDGDTAASAAHVDVAVVDDLGKLDGVIGLSFLWRFASAWNDEDGSLTLSPR